MIFNDIFSIAKKEEKIIVIPVDVDFNIEIESPRDNLYPKVDENTIHGKWIKLMLSDGFSKKELELKIKNGMVGKKEIGNISIVPRKTIYTI